MYSGKSPEAVFYNEGGEEVERVPLDTMNKEELNKLMEVKGIKKKMVEEMESAGAGHDEI